MYLVSILHCSCFCWLLAFTDSPFFGEGSLSSGMWDELISKHSASLTASSSRISRWVQNLWKILKKWAFPLTSQHCLCDDKNVTHADAGASMNCERFEILWIGKNLKLCECLQATQVRNYYPPTHSHGQGLMVTMLWTSSLLYLDLT